MDDRDNRTERDERADAPAGATQRQARKRELDGREDGDGHRSKGERPGNHRPRHQGGRPD